MPPQMNAPESIQPKKEPAGPIVGIVVIVVVMIFGALYFWGSLLNKADREKMPSSASATL